MSTKTCIIVSGPTAVGKTSYGIDLAKKYNTKIISADSRQCYKELIIGVARPSDNELEKVPHYFVASHSIHEKVDVKVFEEYALKAVNEIFETNDVAVMVGGTGLYIKAFTDGLDDIPEVDEMIQKQINDQYLLSGTEWLKSALEKEDRDYFARGEMENPHRMLRALGVKMSAGKSILAFQSGNKVKRDFEIKNIFVNIPREELYHRINSRVDAMIDAGLLEEARSLFHLKHLNALQTVGYRELFSYFEGSVPREKAVDDIKKNTRHFAKRQITWFNKYLNS